MTEGTLPDGARRAADSPALKKAARVGLLARGLVYLLIGLLAARIAAGGSERADQQGALREVAEQPFGQELLWLLAFGFAAYGLWRLGEGVWGRREEADDKKRAIKRIESLVSGVVYVLFFVYALRLATAAAAATSRRVSRSDCSMPPAAKRS